MPKIPKPSKPILIHGLIVTVVLVVTQLVLDATLKGFLLYMPPIGFALFLVAMFGVQPLVLGVINVMVIHRLYHAEGWQIGLWLNGFFLWLFFSTINLLILTVLGVAFSAVLGAVEIFLLAIPFGYLAKYSNRGNNYGHA